MTHNIAHAARIAAAVGLVLEGTDLATAVGPAPCMDCAGAVLEVLQLDLSASWARTLGQVHDIDGMVRAWTR